MISEFSIRNSQPSAVLAKPRPRVLVEVVDHAQRIGDLAEPALGHRRREVVIAEVGAEGVARVVGVAVTRLDVHGARFDEDRGAIDVDAVIVLQLALQLRLGRHPVGAAEKGDVHVGDVEQAAVEGRQRDGAAEDGVVHPDAVLQHHGRQANGDRNIVQVVFVSDAGRDLAQIAFEEQRLGRGIEQDLVIAEAVALVAAEFDARHAADLVAVQRAQEGVNALGGGEAQIDIEIEARRHVGGVDLAVVVVGGAEAEIAVDQQLRPRRVLVAEDGDAVAYRARLVHGVTPFNRRARTDDGALVAVDGELRLDIVGFVGIARIGAEQFTADLGGLRLGRHLHRLFRFVVLAVDFTARRFRHRRQAGALGFGAATRQFGVGTRAGHAGDERHGERLHAQRSRSVLTAAHLTSNSAACG
ncbi:MAG: hypothetical protein IPG43_11730 [Proteobacteria bacterium]|nr:hypothetical protein [Pseudomonadota bacterium]